MSSKKPFANTPTSGSGYTSVGRNITRNFTLNTRLAENGAIRKKDVFSLGPSDRPYYFGGDRAVALFFPSFIAPMPSFNTYITRFAGVAPRCQKIV